MKIVLTVILPLLAATSAAEIAVPITPSESGKGPVIVTPIEEGVGLPISPGATPAPVVPLLTPREFNSGRVPADLPPSPQIDSAPSQFIPSASPQMTTPRQLGIDRPDLR